MYYLQLFVPASLVILMFVIGHQYVDVDYSGVYFEEVLEEVLEAKPDEGLESGENVSEELGEDGLPILPPKYNYLKIENVFQGRLFDTQELFSLELALATFQANVSADFFIKGIYEIESDLVAEISTIILDTTSQNLSSVEGRKLITDKIMMGLNEYLTEEGFDPDIHYVYIINYNII